jgi:Long-chain acyl-CoA synthetases (AMP-forming)
LRGGENVEPLPLEIKLEESVYITTAVVIGQDQRNLGALILPNQEELEIWARNNNIVYASFNELVKNPEVYKFMDGIVREIISTKNGFRAFEKIPRFALLAKPFEVGKELSAKQELMRYKITELYSKEVKNIFKD